MSAPISLILGHTSVGIIINDTDEVMLVGTSQSAGYRRAHLLAPINDISLTSR